MGAKLCITTIDLMKITKFDIWRERGGDGRALAGRMAKIAINHKCDHLPSLTQAVQAVQKYIPGKLSTRIGNNSILKLES